MSPITNGTLLFNEIPQGYPEPGKTTVYDTTQTIDLENVPLNGGILIKALVLSVDPYLRGKMRDPSIESYSPPFHIGQPLTSYGVGLVLRSENPDIKVGEHIAGLINFQQYSVITDLKLSRVMVITKTEESIPWSAYVGVLGMPARTAFYAWKEYSKAKKGEVAFVSSGAGAVGSMVIQLAKLDGLRVIASAGSDEKVEFMKQLGADVAFNYKTDDTVSVLKKEGPIDIYWDNVGGVTLDAAFGSANRHARFLECGMITTYNFKDGYPFKNIFEIVSKRITINGFIEFDLTDKWKDEFYRVVPKKIASGEFKYAEDITNGLEHAGEAIRRIQTGQNIAKSVVLVAEDKP
ncbi:related to reductase RED1 [Armillaria ostoyae]|uniref:Related to reductase RED1 n=1 Tax=Armillaria ostoyae TaxID=47428 RepID=A0A284RJ46_ARMOS|nr:related to reductase RED1 [Armillaria ostoyae]